MIKKILIWGVALVMIFSFTACDVCDDSGDEAAQLAQYKIAGKSLIDDHAATKSQDDYCEENWTAILQAATNGKAAVDAAINKECVDAAVDTAKQTIDEIPIKEVRLGIFYYLQEAYDLELITIEDIKHMVYFMGSTIYRIDDESEKWDSSKLIKIDFEPQMEEPDIADLDLQLINDMKEAFYEKNRQEMDEALQWGKDNGYRLKSQTAIDTISIRSFLGEFNGFFAMRVKSDLWEYPLGSYEECIADIVWSQFPPEIIIFTYQQK